MTQARATSTFASSYVSRRDRSSGHLLILWDIPSRLQDKRHPDGFRLITADHLADIYSVDRLSSKLREEGFTNCRAISRARTPIVKFKDPSSGIDADVKYVLSLRLLGRREVVGVSSTDTLDLHDARRHSLLPSSVNGLAGVINTSLIISYCSLAPFTLRPLIYAVKRWARHNGLNDPYVSVIAGERGSEQAPLLLPVWSPSPV